MAKLTTKYEGGTIKSFLHAKIYAGDVAKWQGKGLQNPHHGFKSRRRLKTNALQRAFCFNPDGFKHPRRGALSRRRLKTNALQRAFCFNPDGFKHPRRGALSRRRLKTSALQRAFCFNPDGFKHPLGCVVPSSPQDKRPAKGVLL
jgi:hypothetical protein